MRVFVGPREVAGIGHGWVQGLRAVGIDAALVCSPPHPFAYSDVTQPTVVRLWAQLGRWRAALTPNRLVSKAIAVALHGALGWLVLFWAVRRFDAFIFMFGRTITDTELELRALRRLRKRTVFVFVGSDARPPYVDGHTFPADRAFDPQSAAVAAARLRRHVQRLEHYADVVVSPRSTAQFLTGRFVNWFAVGIARSAQPVPPPSQGEGVRILHSPSHPTLKGTAEIRSAVERLRARGFAMELVTVEGRPNADVMQALRECHLVVDQLYSDTPMAAFATEAASVGRSVIVCGCAAEQAVEQVAPMPMPPTVYVRPEQFETTLQALVLDAKRRQQIAQQCLAFVQTEWSPASVGGRLRRILGGDIPATWWCEPTEVNHVVGCGLPESLARERVAAVIACGGVAALQVADKPELERAFVAFAGAAAP